MADYTFTLEKSGSDFLLDGQFTLKKTGGVIGEITESTESINNEDVLRQLSNDVDDEDVVTVVIEEGVQSLSRAQRDIVLRRVATTDDGNRSFQCVHSFFLFFLFVE